MECAICFEPWVTDPKSKHVGAALKCGHVFGLTCVRKWLVQCGACPVCKAPGNALTDIQKLSAPDIDGMKSHELDSSLRRALKDVEASQRKTASANRRRLHSAELSASVKEYTKKLLSLGAYRSTPTALLTPSALQAADTDAATPTAYASCSGRTAVLYPDAVHIRHPERGIEAQCSLPAADTPPPPDTTTTEPHPTGLPASEPETTENATTTGHPASPPPAPEGGEGPHAWRGMCVSESSSLLCVWSQSRVLLLRYFLDPPEGSPSGAPSGGVIRTVLDWGSGRIRGSVGVGSVRRAQFTPSGKQRCAVLLHLSEGGHAVLSGKMPPPAPVRRGAALTEVVCEPHDVALPASLTEQPSAPYDLHFLTLNGRGGALLSCRQGVAMRRGTSPWQWVLHVGTLPPASRRPLHGVPVVCVAEHSKDVVAVYPLGPGVAGVAVWKSYAMMRPPVLGTLDVPFGSIRHAGLVVALATYGYAAPPPMPTPEESSGARKRRRCEGVVSSEWGEAEILEDEAEGVSKASSSCLVDSGPSQVHLVHTTVERPDVLCVRNLHSLNTMRHTSDFDSPVVHLHADALHLVAATSDAVTWFAIQ